MRDPFNAKIKRNIQHVCKCGGKFRTKNALCSHIQKSKFRYWEPEGHHDFSHWMECGTRKEYDDLPVQEMRKAQNRAALEG